MAKCDFDIVYSQGIDKTKKIISEAIITHNGEIQINENEGEFTISIPGGKVTGSMVFKNNAISVSITDKPTIISCGIIKSVIQSYL